MDFSVLKMRTFYVDAGSDCPLHKITIEEQQHKTRTATTNQDNKNLTETNSVQKTPQQKVNSNIQHGEQRCYHFIKGERRNRFRFLLHRNQLDSLPER